MLTSTMWRRIGTAGILIFLAIGAAFRLWRIYHSHTSIAIVALTTLLVVAVFLIAIQRARDGQIARVWPPTRPMLVSIGFAVVVALLIDLPGYLSVYAHYAQARVLARQASHTSDGQADAHDGAIIALDDDPLGYTRYAHIDEDVYEAARSSRDECPSAIARVDNDERGFRATALRAWFVEDAVARGHCAYLADDTRDAQRWFLEAARRYLSYSASPPSPHGGGPIPDIVIGMASGFAKQGNDRPDYLRWKAAFDKQAVAFRRRHPCHPHGGWAC